MQGQGPVHGWAYASGDVIRIVKAVGGAHKGTICIYDEFDQATGFHVLSIYDKKYGVNSKKGTNF